MQHHSTLCNTVQHRATTCNTMQYRAIPCNTMQYNAIPWYYAIKCNTMQHHVIPCNTMQYHSIPCNTMQYNAIPCNTMQYINNCWRSVPLLCGQYNGHFLSTLNKRKAIYGFSFFLHGKKILKIQLMIRLHILWSSWSSPSCKKSLLLSLCKKFVIFVSYCHPGHRYFAKSYFRRLLVMITYSCFLQW